MDDSLIREFCKERGLTFRWKTWKEGERAYADIEVRDGSEIAFTARNNCLSNEQHVLDNLMRWAIEHIAEKPRYVISGWRHSESLPNPATRPQHPGSPAQRRARLQ